MPKTKPLSFADQLKAAALADRSSRPNWVEKLPPELRKELDSLIDAIASGEIEDPNLLAAHRVWASNCEDLGMKPVAKSQFAVRVKELVAAQRKAKGKK